MADDDGEARDQAWYAPKSHGYGAGLPIAWQGWAVLGAYLAAMIVPTLWLPRGRADLFAWLTVFLAVATLATTAVTLVAKRKTRGGWRWRWGEDE